MSVGLEEMPSPMYLAGVDCVGCHFESVGGAESVEFSGTTQKASDEACVKCHGPEFRGIAEETRSALRTSLAGLEEKLAEARSVQAGAELSKKETAKLDAMLRKAERWLRFVRASRGEHNIFLASKTAVWRTRSAHF